ncbi:MAG: cysteine--tRNA ligase [Bacilli bacterium]|jgi:cysteinyl-tRNA synthetase|nr:cysteine--tRNA ligase [Bacilli bacterium]
MHEVRLFNSLGMKKETFVPLVPGKVSIYVCGPTVYNDPHIGNFRPVIVFDVLRRLFIHLGYQVTFVSNYTDVDDKIIKRAAELGISEKELTESVIEEYRRLVDEVGCLQPDLTPKPTVFMPQIIAYVKDLVEKGAAYVSGGDVYLRVRGISGYGELSGNSVEDLESGARIAIGEKKEDPLDFALWKKTDSGIRWKADWSEGRPGWHTECCVMIDSIFRDQNGYIDIHGGGFDLKFPHHENEMAQAKAHNGNKLARYWLHNGFINVNDEKMSKSLGNVVLAKDVVKEYGGIPFRLLVLASPYRAPSSFSAETIREAQVKYGQLKEAAKKGSLALQLAGESVDGLKPSDESEFLDAICDDLNTPNALAVLYEENKKLNSLLMAGSVDIAALKDSFAKVRAYEDVLGIVLEIPHLSEDDKRLYHEYYDAKGRKDYAASDALRGVLIAKGLF